MIAAALLLLVASADTCAEPKIVVRGASFGTRFGPGSTERADAEASIRAGFRQACAKGLLKGLAGASTLELTNAPDGNVAVLTKAPLKLEFPFVTSDGSVGVPEADDVEEAIFCAVVGATAQEQEESGRCLAD